MDPNVITEEINTTKSQESILIDERPKYNIISSNSDFFIIFLIKKGVNQQKHYAS